MNGTNPYIIRIRNTRELWERFNDLSDIQRTYINNASIAPIVACGIIFLLVDAHSTRSSIMQHVMSGMKRYILSCIWNVFWMHTNLRSFFLKAFLLRLTSTIRKGTNDGFLRELHVIYSRHRAKRLGRWKQCSSSGQSISIAWKSCESLVLRIVIGHRRLQTKVSERRRIKYADS